MGAEQKGRCIRVGRGQNGGVITGTVYAESKICAVNLFGEPGTRFQVGCGKGRAIHAARRCGADSRQSGEIRLKADGIDAQGCRHAILSKILLV